MNRVDSILTDLPQAMDWPEPSDHLTTRVVSRLEADGRPSRWRRWAAVAVVALVAVVIGLVPATRQAVADLFQEASVRIGFIEKVPDLPLDLDLGTELTLDRAADQVALELRVPDALGEPTGVFVDGATVSMVWEGPVLLTQRSAGDTFAEKGVGPDTEATEVVVDGNPGVWIEGAPHTLTFLDDEGNPLEETTRLAANVLLWTAGGVDYRLELDEDLDRALDIAGSMAAVE